MINLRTISRFTAVLTAFLFVIPANAQAPVGQTITLQLNNGAQPAPNVTIFLLTGGNKLTNNSPQPSGATDTTGTFSFPPGLLSANKPHTQVTVYVRTCQNGKVEIYLVPKGQEDQVPPDDDSCHRRRAGVFWLDGGSKITVQIGEGGGVTQTGQPGISPQTHIPIWVQIAGGPGFSNAPNAFGGCTALSQAFPGGTCGSSQNSFAFDVDGSVHVWHVMARGGYWRANSVQLDASGPVLGGGTDTVHSSMQPEAGYLTGGFCIPLGNKISLIPEAGGAFWAVNTKKLETVTSGTAAITSRDSLHFTGVGPQAGAAVHVDVTRRVGFEIRYAYAQMSNKPAINEHINLFFFNLTIKLFGKGTP